VPCKVKLKKSSLDYFRRLARQSELEIEAYLIGTVVSPFLVKIDQFCYPQEYTEQTKDNVQWSPQDYKRVRELAEKQGKRIVGTIHSHPKADVVLSPDDYESHFTEGFRVLGICSVNEKKTKVHFWINDSSLPCVVEYI